VNKNINTVVHRPGCNEGWMRKENGIFIRLTVKKIIPLLPLKTLDVTVEFGSCEVNNPWLKPVVIH